MHRNYTLATISLDSSRHCTAAATASICTEDAFQSDGPGGQGVWESFLDGSSRFDSPV